MNGEPAKQGAWGPEAGVTYMALLFVIAIMGVTLAATGMVWHTVAKRSKEAELLWVGQQYRQAIKQYYHATPGASGYPADLKDLLKDPRQLGTRRYLRKLYPDPITGKDDWGLVKTQDQKRITGVYSLSEDEPIKVANFDDVDKDFAGKSSYQEWKFVFSPTAATTSTNTTLAPQNSAPQGLR